MKADKIFKAQRKLEKKVLDSKLKAPQLKLIQYRARQLCMKINRKLIEVSK